MGKCPTIIDTEGTTNTANAKKDTTHTIVLPLRENFVNNLPDQSSCKELAKHISDRSKDQVEIDVGKIEELWSKARNEIASNELSFIKKLKKDFQKNKIEFNDNNDNKEEYKPEEILFMVATSFQYYSWHFDQWSYDLYIIRPNKTSGKSGFACFSLAVKPDNDKILPYLKSLQHLIEEGFSGYRKIEVDAWKQLSQDIHYYWMWKKEYENRKERFEALCNAIKFIVQGICEKNKIKYKDIPHRVKEFDKFYDKLVGKINEPSEKLETLPHGLEFSENLKEIRYDADRKLLIFKGVMSEKEKNTLLTLSQDYSYQKAVENLFKNSTKLNDIFRSPMLSFDELIEREFVKDIAGIRVNCYYKDDAHRLWELIKKDKGSENTPNGKKAEYALDLFGAPKEPSEEPGIFEYPRFHLCVKLAKERVELPEYGDLRDIPCEVQIGTILEEGWSEVDHEIIYKHGSFLPEDKIEELKKESFSGLLPCIRKTDEGFVELRESRKTEDFNYGGAS